MNVSHGEHGHGGHGPGGHECGEHDRGGQLDMNVVCLFSEKLYHTILQRITSPNGPDFRTLGLVREGFKNPGHGSLPERGGDSPPFR